MLWPLLLVVFAASSLVEPGLDGSYRDPVYGARVVRLSQTTLGRPGMVPEYSKAQAWNADQSRFLLRGTDATTYLYDGRSLERLKQTALPEGDIEPRWSPTNSDILTYVLGDSIYRYSVKHDHSTRIARYQGVGALSSGAEQEVSRDGRYFALHGKVKEGAGGRFISTRAFVVDLKSGKRGPSKTLRPPDGNRSDFLDYVAITPDGKNVMVMWAAYGADLYTRNWRYVRRLTDWDEHGDFCLERSGKWSFVQAHYRAEPNDEVVEATPLDGSPRRTLWQAPVYNLALHISCRNTEQPGWAYLSSYWDGLGQRPGPTEFENEIFKLGLDSTVAKPVISHLAQTQMTERADYFDEPHATVRQDGKVILFASNFGRNVGSESYVDSYAVDLR